MLPEQRREISRLMTTAGIRPTTTKIRPGDAELARITGARTPSGVAVTLAVPISQAPAAATTSAPRRRSGPRSALPADVDINGNARRRRPKQRMGTTGGATHTAAGFSGKASTGSKPGSGSKTGSNYGTGRQRRQAN